MASGTAAGRGRPAHRHGSDPPGFVPDRVPDDPHDRLAVPASDHRRLRPPCGRGRARPPAWCPPGRAPSSAAGPGQVLKTTRIGGAAVITNAKGRTLYWFVPDTATTSKCYGACASYWPPVFGTPKAGPGVTGTLGMIKRSDGTTQATYDGHPLYTYIVHTAAGQAHGNNINLHGGVWHEVLVSG